MTSAYANLQGLKMEKPRSEEEAKALTVVFWDIKLYPVPSGFDPRQVRPCIKRILKDYGYSGPLSVTAVGDLKDVPSDVMRGLLPSGVSLVNSGDMTLASHISEFTDSYPPPATVLSISNPDPCFHCCFQIGGGYNVLEPFPSCDTFQSFLLAAVSGAPKEERLECDSYWDCLVCHRDPPGRSYETLASHLSSEEHHQLTLERLPRPGDRGSVCPSPPIYSPPMPMDLSGLISKDEFWALITPAKLARHEIDLAAVTSVFWDLKTCPVPPHFNPRLVGPYIKRNLECRGHSGPLAITAVGPLTDFDADILRAVSASGIVLHHVPHGSKDIAGLVLEFALTHPPPANIVFITDDPLFDFTIMGYNRVIISSLENALTVPGALGEDKCTEWICSVCCSGKAFQGFENLTTHLSSNAHKRTMLDWLPPNARFARFAHQGHAHGVQMRT